MNSAEAVAEGRGKTLGEAKWAAVRELRRQYEGASAEQVEFEVIEEAKGEGTAHVRATLNLDRWGQPPEVQNSEDVEAHDREDPLDRGDSYAEEEADQSARLRSKEGLGGEGAVEFVGRVAEMLVEDCQVEFDEGPDEVVVTVYGEDLGLFIGKHGRTIDSVQHLLLHVIFGDGPRKKLVVVDASGYRDRRREQLQRIAEKSAHEAKKYNREVQLEAMGAAERRIVHTFLAEIDGIETHSEGKEPRRYILVTPSRM